MESLPEEYLILYSQGPCSQEDVCSIKKEISKIERKIKEEQAKQSQSEA